MPDIDISHLHAFADTGTSTLHTFEYTNHPGIFIESGWFSFAQSHASKEVMKRWMEIEANLRPDAVQVWTDGCALYHKGPTQETLGMGVCVVTKDTITLHILPHYIDHKEAKGKGASRAEWGAFVEGLKLSPKGQPVDFFLDDGYSLSVMGLHDLGNEPSRRQIPRAQVDAAKALVAERDIRFHRVKSKAGFVFNLLADSAAKRAAENKLWRAVSRTWARKPLYQVPFLVRPSLVRTPWLNKIGMLDLYSEEEAQARNLARQEFCALQTKLLKQSRVKLYADLRDVPPVDALHAQFLELLDHRDAEDSCVDLQLASMGRLVAAKREFVSGLDFAAAERLLEEKKLLYMERDLGALQIRNRGVCAKYGEDALDVLLGSFLLNATASYRRRAENYVFDSADFCTLLVNWGLMPPEQGIVALAELARMWYECRTLTRVQAQDRLQEMCASLDAVLAQGLRRC